MISDEQKRNAKERAVTELKRVLAITFYLWVVLSLLEIHRFVVLREVSPTSLPGCRIGFAAINALILSKVIVIGQALHLGEQLNEERLIHSAFFKSVVFALSVVCFNVVEEVIIGVIHGKSIVASIPQMGGGGLEGKLLVGVMAFVLLIPFFLFTEVQRVLGRDKLHSLIIQKRSKADAA
jgi:hypothetical protein